MDIEILLLMGFFIHDLCWELEELYWDSEISDREKIIVYRGQALHNTESHFLKKKKFYLIHYILCYIADKLKFPDEARDHYEEVLELMSDLTEDERHRLAPTYAGIARLFYREKDFDSALSYYEEAIKLALIASTIDKIKLEFYYNEVALLFRDNDHYDKALKNLDDALKCVIEGKLPSTHPDMAKIYFNIGSVHYREKHYDESLEYYQKCLNIQLRSLPSNHPALVRSHIEMSKILKERNCIEEAIKQTC
ncbi:hypothetical protein I4U23_031322 [Adineta vaga]|nr:hypothetical protein I4U23_031322 [Adineta vaga]